MGSTGVGGFVLEGKLHLVHRIQAELQRLQLHQATGRNVELPLVSGASDREL